jgi:hypothetical protein
MDILNSGWASTAVAVIALIISAYSLYLTSLRRPKLSLFVPPVIQYSSPYTNSNFEVLGIPVTIANSGARTGTVLSIDLVATNSAKKLTKRFYSAEFGRWTMENARGNKFRPFAPLALQGRSSTSESVLFYSRPDESVGQIVEPNSDVRFTLTIRAAEATFARKPKPLSFEVAVSDIDHRIFTTGTLPLYNKTWETAVN